MLKYNCGNDMPPYFLKPAFCTRHAISEHPLNTLLDFRMKFINLVIKVYVVKTDLHVNFNETKSRRRQTG